MEVLAVAFLAVFLLVILAHLFEAAPKQVDEVVVVLDGSVVRNLAAADHVSK